MTETSAAKAKRYLAWDTSSATGVVTAFEIVGERLVEIAGFSLSLETSRHSERLLWSIDTVLQSAGWKLEEIAGIAVGVGPGSFTGLRIGVTTAKMLASTLKISVTPISSLALLGQYALSKLAANETELNSTLIAVCTDATKGEWFSLLATAAELQNCVSFSESTHAKLWNKEVMEAAITPSELGEKLKAGLAKIGKDAKWLAAGQSVERYPEIWNAFPQNQRVLGQAPTSLHRIQPEILTEMAFRAIRKGLALAPSEIKPRYLRDSEAEVKLRKGELNLNPLRS